MIIQAWLTLLTTGTQRQRGERGGWVARIRAGSCCALCLSIHLPSHCGQGAEVTRPPSLGKTIIFPYMVLSSYDML